MALEQYTALSNITLTSSSASVVFSSIPAIYKDLILVCSMRSTRSATVDYLGERLNDDSGSNYSHIAMWGDNNNTTNVGTNSSQTYMYGPNVAGASLASGTFASVIYQFMDYSATDKHKTVLIRQGAPGVEGGRVEMDATRWASTSAVNSITLSLPYVGGSFAAGSTFSLYGVK